MSDQQPRMTYTRSMAFISFLYALWYIETNPQVDQAVLVFLGAVIAFWALGRATLSELIQALKEKWK
jgi:hypothetical protein